ncbi:MAG TPA: hypothetical protein VN682_01245 [Terriglobales bacterium]|nr:hypothetical protein [Terriglobales bacterium]
MKTILCSIIVLLMIAAYAGRYELSDRNAKLMLDAVSYSARTDLSVVPMPKTTPSIGNAKGVGERILDRDFQTQIYRLTDVDTLPNARYDNQKIWQMNCGGWGAFRVSNLDSTKLFICNNGGATFLLPFDPASGKPGKAERLPSDVPGYPQWSKRQKNVAFALGRSSEGEIVRIDFSGAHPRVTPVVDLAKVPNCAQEFSGKRGWRELSVAWDDATFAVAASTGSQDTAHNVYVWNAKTGCQKYDTQAGTVNGSKVSGDSNSFYIHSIKISGNGQVLMIGGLKRRHFWHVGTATVESLRKGGINDGHYAMGYNAYLNDAGPTSDGKWCKLGMAIWDLSDLSRVRYLLSAQQCGNRLTPGDDHVSWNNDDTTDKQPFATSTTLDPDEATRAPWQNEILVMMQDGTVHREAHTFNSGKSKSFACRYAIGSISQDGEWFFFSSDWEETLGKDKSGDPRCDDFAVRLH